MFDGWKVLKAFVGAAKSSIQSNGSLENVVERVVMPDVTLKSDTLKSSSKPLRKEKEREKFGWVSLLRLLFPFNSSLYYLSACDAAPKLFGEDVEEQKLSIDTESLPVLDFLMDGGLDAGDSSKLMSWTSLFDVACGGILGYSGAWCVLSEGGAGIFGGILSSTLLVCDALLLFFEAPNRFERMLMDFWLPDFLTEALARTLGGGGLGGAGFLFTVIAALWWLLARFLPGGGGAGRVGIVILFIWESKLKVKLTFSIGRSIQCSHEWFKLLNERKKRKFKILLRCQRSSKSDSTHWTIEFEVKMSASLMTNSGACVCLTKHVQNVYFGKANTPGIENTIRGDYGNGLCSSSSLADGLILLCLTAIHFSWPKNTLSGVCCKLKNFCCSLTSRWQQLWKIRHETWTNNEKINYIIDSKWTKTRENSFWRNMKTLTAAASVWADANILRCCTFSASALGLI